MLSNGHGRENAQRENWLIDANIEKSVVRLMERDEKNNPIGLDLKEAAVETKTLTEVYIGTLAPYNAFGPGNYILSVVKQMSATDGFLSLSSEKRECEKEKFEDCQRRLFQEATKSCRCTPQNLIPAQQDQSQVLDFLSALSQNHPKPTQLFSPDNCVLEHWS